MPTSYKSALDEVLQEQEELRTPDTPAPLAPKAANPYEAWLTRQDEQTKRQLAGAIAYGNTLNPEIEARVQRLGLHSSYPPEVVRENLEHFERIQKTALQQGVALDSLIKDNPALVEFMRDPDNTGLVIDDLANAGSIERFLKLPIATLITKTDKGLDVGPGLAQVELGFRGQPEASAIGAIGEAIGTTPAKLAARALEKYVIGTPEENEKRIKFLQTEIIPRWYGEEGFLMTGYAEALKLAPQMVGAMASGAVGATLGGLVGAETGPGALITAKTGAYAGAYAWSAIQERGNLYLDIRDMRDEDGNPVEPEIAWAMSTAGGAISGGIELIGFKYVTKLLPKVVASKIVGDATKKLLTNKSTMRAIGHWVRDYAKGTVAETGEELLQDLTQIAAAETAKLVQGGEWRDMTAEEFYGRIADTTYKTFSAMVVGGGLFGGPRLGLDVVEARRAHRDAVRMELLAGTVRESKLGERMPGKIEELTNLVTTGSTAKFKHAFIPIEDFNRIVEAQGADPAEVAERIFGSAQPYQDAVVAGGDLVIPAGKYLSQVMRTDLHDALKDHVRLNQGGLSIAQVAKAQADTESILVEAIERDPETYDPNEREVYREEKRKVVEAGRDEIEADAAAKITTHVLSTLARKGGRKLLDLYRQYDVRIGRAVPGEAEGQRLSQGPARDELVGRDVDELVVRATIEEARRQGQTELVERLEQHASGEDPLGFEEFDDAYASLFPAGSAEPVPSGQPLAWAARYDELVRGRRWRSLPSEPDTEFLDMRGDVPGTAAAAVVPFGDRFAAIDWQGNILSAHDRRDDARLAAERFADGKFRAGTLPDLTLREAARVPPLDYSTYVPERTKAGKFKGTPEWVKTMRDYETLLSNLRGFVVEGESNRYWYEISAEAMYELTGRNLVLTEKLVQLFAIYSAGVHVISNTVSAVRAYNQWSRGVPKEEFYTAGKVKDGKAVAVLYDNKPDWEGRKTSSFYRNLMHYFAVQYPDQLDELALPKDVLTSLTATIDVWMLRAMGYKKAVVSDSAAGRYPTAENIMRRIAAEMNLARDPNTPPYEVHQVQAMIWSSVRARFYVPSVTAATEQESLRRKYSKVDKKGKWHPPTNVDKKIKHDRVWRRHAMAVPAEEALRAVLMSRSDFASTMSDRSNVVAWEGQPGAGTTLSDHLSGEMNAQLFGLIVDEDGNDLVAQAVGIPLSRVVKGSGGYKRAISENRVTETVPTSVGTEFDNEQVWLYARIIQVILQQEAVPWYGRRAYNFEKVHVVVEGDTLESVARKYGKDVQEIRDANPRLKKRDTLKPGWNLTIPLPKAVRLTFTENLSRATERAFYDLLRQATHESMSYTRVSPNEVEVANWSPLTNEQFEAAIDRFGDEHGQALGIEKDIRYFTADGEYGPGYEEAVLQLDQSLGGRPDALAWVRDRAEQARKIVRSYSGREAEERASEFAIADQLAPEYGPDRDLRSGTDPPAGGLSDAEVTKRAEEGFGQLAFPWGTPGPPGAGAVSLAGGEKAPVWRPRGPGGVRRLFSLIKDTWKATGFVNIVGANISSHHDLALLARMWRDPRYETGRVVWVDAQGNVLAHEAVTMYQVSATSVQPTRKGRGDAPVLRMWEEMRKRRDRLGAAGYWLVHNHPSGSVTPSPQDITSAQWFGGSVGGFLGEVIINHKRYGAIRPTPGHEISAAEEPHPRTARQVPVQEGVFNYTDDMGVDPVFHDRHGIFAMRYAPAPGWYDKPETMARIGRRARAEHGSSPSSVLLVYLDAKGYVRAAEDAPTSMLELSGASLRDHTRGRKRHYGAHWVIGYTERRDLMDPLFTAMRWGALDDAVVDAVGKKGQKGYKRAAGARQQGYVPVASSTRDANYRLYQSDDLKRGYIEFKGGQRFDIGLFDGRADPSTLLHELGHFYLEVMGDLAAEENASKEIQADWKRALKWLGVKSRAELGEEHREKWADAWESYLMEGRAPTLELSATFARTRAWMLSIYEGVRRVAPIDDDIRGIFDRMLASEEEIQAARSELNLQPIEALREVLSPAEWEAYVEAGRQAVAEAEDELRARLLADRKVATSEAYAGVREKARAEAIEELGRVPAMRVLRYFERGEIAGLEELPVELLKGKFLGYDEQGKPQYEAGAAKLSRKLIGERYGKAALEALRPRASQVYRRQGGLDPEVLATYLGLADGQEMIDILSRPGSWSAAVEEATQRKLEARYGNLLQERGRLAQEALAASTGPGALDTLLTELRGIRKLLGAAAGKAERLDPAVLRERALAYATAQKIEHLAPHRHLQAARKHGTEAARASGAKDWAAAYDAKMKQAWAMALYRASRDTLDKVESAVTFLQRFTQNKTRARLGKAGLDYLTWVDSLLEQFDLKYATSPALRRLEGLRDWLKQKNAEEEDIVVPESVLARAERVNYREVTAQEFFELRDAVQSIYRQAKLKTQLLHGKKVREMDEAMDELIAAMAANMRDRGPVPIDPEMRKKQRSILSQIDSRLLRLEGLMEMLDGGALGPWHSYVFDRIADAQAEEADLAVEFTLKLTEQLAALPADRRNRLFLDQRSIKSLGGEVLTFQAIIAVALNTGNEGNLQRLMDGRKWSQEVLDEILGHMTREDWQFVQGTWNTLEELWPRIAALEERATGLAPPKVERRSFTVTLASGEKLKIDGGYYPLVYDREESNVGRKQVEGKDNISLLFDNRITRAMTVNGHTQERVKKFAGPVKLSINVIPGHVTQVIHDLTHREAVLDIYRLITNDKMVLAMHRYLGPEKYRQILEWTKRQANSNQAVGDAFMEKMLSKARTNTSIVAMGAKVMLATQNFANFANVLEKVGITYMTPAMREVWTHPLKFAQFVGEKSGEMRHRFSNLDRDIRHALQSGAATDARRFFFKLQQYTDAAIAYPAWVGAYRQALDQGLSEKDAIGTANAIVRTTLGAGAAKDLAELQTGGELQRSVTMFYGWFSVVYLRARMMGHDIRRSKEEGRVIRDMPGFIARTFAWWLVPAIASELLMLRRPGDDDDDETWLGWIATTALYYPAAAVPLVRDVINYIDKGFDPRVGPLVPILKTVGDAGLIAAKYLSGEAEEEDKKRVAKTVTRLAGYGTGLVPASQFEITAGYLYDVMTGEEKPEDVIEFAHYLLARRPRNREKNP